MGADTLAAAVNVARVFSWPDYVVFGLMLIISAVIGIYHGLGCGKKKEEQDGQTATKEFLTANGQLGTIPVAISMLASFLSSITLMGQPAQVYLYGPQLWIFGLASFLIIPFIGYVFIPFFVNLKITSAYEYFGRRFNRPLQLLASTLFSIQMVLYLALVLYAPALAMHQVTGMNIEAVVSVMYIVVIFYTTIGGMKAVVWTDCFQVVVLYASMIAVLVKGTSDIGGISVVWSRNSAMGRTDFFNFSPDPTDIYTFWGTLFGAAGLHLATYGANQLQIQRYLSVKSVEAARKMIYINTVGWTIVVFLTVYAGMLIFAKYYDCDPLATGVVKKPDQLFPLYVMDTLGEYQGFPGLFVAGIFSAGLSTVSTGLNSLAAIWFSEMDGTGFKDGLSEKRSGLTVKFLALAFGLVSFALVFVVPYMGGLVPVAISLSSFFSGSLFGLFILGIYFPFTNAIGACFGLLSGCGIVGWLTIGAQVAAEHGKKLYNSLPTSTDNCPVMNQTLTTLYLRERNQEEAFVLYRISFLWYGLLAFFITVTVGITVSLLVNLFTKSSSKNDSDSTPSTENTSESTTLNMDAYVTGAEFLLQNGSKDSRSILISSKGKVPKIIPMGQM